MSSGTSGDSRLPTPGSSTSKLHQGLQRSQCTIPISAHSIRKTQDDLVVGSTSSSLYCLFAAAHPSSSRLPHQGHHSQSPSTSPILWETPPCPQLVQPHRYGENSWSAHTVPSPPPSLFDPCQMIPRWNAPSSPVGYQLLHSCVEMSASIPIGNPYGSSWQLQENMHKTSSEPSHRVYHPQVLDSTPLNYPTYYSDQDLGDPRLPYPSSLSVVSIPSLMLPFETFAAPATSAPH